MNRILSTLLMGFLLVLSCTRQPSGSEGDAPATPVYHLLDPKVARATGYSKVIIQ